jgi:hypothetical protein
MPQRVVAVEDDVDGHPLPAKPGSDRVRHDLHVLNDQDSHGVSWTLLFGEGLLLVSLPGPSMRQRVPLAGRAGLHAGERLIAAIGFS